MKKQFLYLVSICVMAVILLFSLSSCACEHEWADATCTKPITCTKCGETLGLPSKHDYERVGCEKYLCCKNCGSNSQTKADHLFTGNCGEFGTCRYCSKASPEIIQHRWNGNIGTGTITCSNCKNRISYQSIKGKNDHELMDVERAYIYWQLDYYLTATTSSGKYAYSTYEAFQRVSELFDMPISYLKDDFWGVNSVSNHNCYKKYY